MYRGFERVLPVLGFIGLIVLALHRITAYDIWWQIAAGKWILVHGFPQTDPFSFGFPGREWIEPRWIFCALAWKLFDLGGPNALILFKLLMLSGTFTLLWRLGGSDSRWATVSGFVVALAGSHDRFMVRPELVSFLFLSFTLFALERYRAGGRRGWLVALPLLQVVWSNAHTLWILGPAVQWIYWSVEASAARLPFGVKRIATTGARPLRPMFHAAWTSTTACLLTPYFIRGLAFPFRLLTEISGDHVLNRSIAEFQGPLSAVFLGWNYRSVVLACVVGFSLAGFLVNRSRAPLGRLAVWSAFAVLALMAQRNVALLALVSGWSLVLNLTEWHRAVPSPPSSASRAALTAGTIYLLVMIPLVASDAFYRHQGRVERFGIGVSDRKFPIRAMEFIDREGLPRPVLGSLGDGGYLLFEGGEHSVYVDARLEVYGGAILERALELTWTGEGLAQEVERTGVRTVLVRNLFQHRRLLLELERSESWIPVYFDHLHVVYVRSSPETTDIVGKLGFRWDDPVERRIDRPSRIAPPDRLTASWARVGDGFVDERLGSLYLGFGNYERALARFRRAVELEPSNRRASLFLGLFEAALGNEAQAGRRLSQVPSRLLERPDVQLMAGEIHLWAERPAAAVVHFRNAIRLAGPDPFHVRRLVRAAWLSGDYALAATELRAMIARGEGGHEAWNSLGNVQLRQGHLADAVESFRSSLEVSPGQPEVFRLLQRVYADLGRSEDAAEAGRRAGALETE